MAEDITIQLAQLQSLSRQQVMELWQNTYRKPAPSGIQRELLVRFLAYQIQENSYGGLKPKTRAELGRIARGFEKSGSTKRKVQVQMKPGTRLVRGWHGKTHEVYVTESGFEYHGAPYRSLSVIARKITGTPWSGPAFFGLKQQSQLRQQS